MKCPVCKEITLVMSARQNIEIDFCPECRGVWLDRGELDKIIELSVQTPAPQEAPRINSHDHREDDRHHERRQDDHYRDNQDYNRRNEKPYRKRNFLMDLFD